MGEVCTGRRSAPQSSRACFAPAYLRGYTESHHLDIMLMLDDIQGKEGVIIVKTKQAILVTHYPEKVQPGQAATVVEKLADYLTGVGY
jgi:hypothetical protein